MKRLLTLHYQLPRCAPVSTHVGCLREVEGRNKSKWVRYQELKPQAKMKTIHLRLSLCIIKNQRKPYCLSLNLVSAPCFFYSFSGLTVTIRGFLPSKVLTWALWKDIKSLGFLSQIKLHYLICWKHWCCFCKSSKR